MNELIGMGTLNCIYFFLFALGLGYALVAVVMGGLSHVEIPGVDIDIPGLELHPGEPDIHIEMPFHHDISHSVDHPEVGLSPLSPIILATFITTFGGTGIIVNTVTYLRPVWGLLISAVSGVGLSSVMFLLYTRVLLAAQGSSEVQAGELVGAWAETTTPIPEGQVGEVVLVARGARVSRPARSADGPAIPRGTAVEIVEEAGNVVMVRAKGARAHVEE
ncbi:MAG: NfeD family protein [Chloroflexota bacterium]|nr:NfeD family protein [Chloroflexota bacterium]